VLSDVTRAGASERQKMLEEFCEIAQGYLKESVEPEDYQRETLDTWGGKKKQQTKTRIKMKRFRWVNLMKHVKNMPDSFHP